MHFFCPVQCISVKAVLRATDINKKMQLVDKPDTLCYNFNDYNKAVRGVMNFPYEYGSEI